MTDGLPTYPQAIDDVFGIRPRHTVTRSVADKPNKDLVEWLNGTIRERTRVIRGMKSRNTTEELLEGWTVHYNYFRLMSRWTARHRHRLPVWTTT